MWVGLIQSLEELNRTQRRRKIKFPFFLIVQAGTWISSCPRSQTETQTEIYTVGSPALRPFNHTFDFPRVSGLQAANCEISHPSYECVCVCDTKKVSSPAACHYQNQWTETRIESLWALYSDTKDLRRQCVMYLKNHLNISSKADFFIRRNG